MSLSLSPDSWLNESINKHNLTPITFVLGNLNDLTRFNNFAKSKYIYALPLHNDVFIIRDRITYNLGKIMNCKQGLPSGSQTGIRCAIEDA